MSYSQPFLSNAQHFAGKRSEAHARTSMPQRGEAGCRSFNNNEANPKNGHLLGAGEAL